MSEHFLIEDLKATLKVNFGKAGRVAKNVIDHDASFEKMFYAAFEYLVKENSKALSLLKRLERDKEGVCRVCHYKDYKDGTLTHDPTCDLGKLLKEEE